MARIPKTLKFVVVIVAVLLPDLIDQNILEPVTRAQRVWITPTLPTMNLLASHVQFVNQIKNIKVPAP
ncbi:TNF receptor superfamily member 10c [Homo sapiens]|uniref:TNF receptor superfamily member 10c n=2 Tax=Homo sapiens TaxID=9606 RepID=E5RJI1_HUMAN|nr:TNF receptor superfamily member 10c [Homo sapiens]KAI4009938.1 TNF receptor superfamily member 10c [Homo sapiens]